MNDKMRSGGLHDRELPVVLYGIEDEILVSPHSGLI